MKLRPWQLYSLCTYIPLNPICNNCVSLAWNVCQSTKRLEDYTSYNQASVKPRWAESWTILTEVLDLPFLNKVDSESWSSTDVSPSVGMATTTLQIFYLAYFWVSLPTFIVACLSSSSPQASVSFFLKGSLSITISSFPFIGCSFRLGLATGWEASQWNLHISGGEPAFPPGISQFPLTACWDPGLRNPTSQPSQQDLCNFSHQQEFQPKIA